MAKAAKKPAKAKTEVKETNLVRRITLKAANPNIQTFRLETL